MAAPANMKLLASYLEYSRRERGRSPQTIYQYATSLRNFLGYVGPRNVLDLGPDDLRPWVHEATAKGRGAREAGSEPSPATVKRKVAELRSFYRWLHEVEGVIRRNPALALSAPVVHNENPKPCPEEAWKRLWAADLELSDRVAFGLGYFCGLRRHEVTLLAPGHVVDVPKPLLLGFKRKGGKKANLPWLSCVRLYGQRRPDLIGGGAETFTEAFVALREERVGRPTLVSWADSLNRNLGRNRDPQTPKDFVDPFQFNRRLGKALEAAGLAAGSFTPHQLRHSFCSNMLDMGVPLLDVSRLANHSTVVVTQRYLASKEDPLEGLLEVGEEAAHELVAPSRFG